ncbi:MAG: hypothetical protein Q8Q12_04855 [bacterium]|nr:hypothetical protein [bacterium]
MKTLILTVALVCLCVCLPIGSSTLAVTRYVDGSVSASGDGASWDTAFKAIQEGIDAASDGDTVLVAEGTYVENINFNGKNITLTSTDPLDPTVVANTIIDGNQAGSVITFSGTETESCVLSGFTLRNGGAEYGGGVHGAKTHATVRNNVITGNLAQKVGGGLWDCSGRIQNNVIAKNRAGDSGGGQAYCGGIIENNTVVDNRAEHEGGGVYKCGDMQNCIIWGNEGREVFLGCTGPSHSCIQGWYYSGGGNIRHFPYFVDASNCDYHLKSYSPCVDAGNPSSEFGMEPEPTGERIDMGAYGNTPQATPASLDTDVDLLPDDWEITVFGNLAQGTSDDWDGDWRSSLEEYHQGTNPASLQRLFVNSSVAVSGDGGSWETAFKTIQEALDATPEGYTIFVAEGVYEENICFHGKNVTLRSKDPLGSNAVSKTVIDGGGHDSVVAFSGTEDETCVLAGFTIRNGKATEGGGIRGGVSTKWTHATIRNNVIIGNAAGRDGGGLAYCLGVIQNNIVSGNSAGGVVAAYATAHPGLSRIIPFAGIPRRMVAEGSADAGPSSSIASSGGTLPRNSTILMGGFTPAFRMSDRRIPATYGFIRTSLILRVATIIY